jgi:hypothetical protein
MESREQRSPSRRRWFRFSLRTFFVLFTLVCVALGLYVKRVRDRYIAIETIKRWGGEVTFSKPQPATVAKRFSDTQDRVRAVIEARQMGRPRPEFPENLPQGSSFWRSMFGRFGKYHGSEVHRVTLIKSAFTPSDVTIDVGIVSAFPEATHLALGEVNPAALAKLPRMPRLESLIIESGVVTDEALQCILGMPQLQRLTLPSALLKSRGMATIGSRTKLTSLNLNRSSLADQDFVHLMKLPLQNLSLNQTNTSDAAIPLISQLKALKELNIEYTNITEDGVQRLLRALPQCKIVHDYPWLE